MIRFIFPCLLGLLAAGPAHAQRNARSTLRSAMATNWYVRVATPLDSAEGPVVSVFRDTVRFSRKALYIPAVQRVDRRVGDEWRNIWTAEPAPSARSETAVVAGTSMFVYAGTTAALFPGPYYTLPPPVTAGLELGVRNATGEYTIGARTLLYPAPLVIATADVGRNFRGSGRRYSGVAVGGMFATEGEFTPYPMLSVRAGVLPDKQSGGRVEFRGDAIVGDGAAIIVSLHLGFDNVIPN